MSPTAAAELTSRGADAEVTAYQLLHQPECDATRLAAFIREVGYRRIILSSDDAMEGYDEGGRRRYRLRAGLSADGVVQEYAVRGPDGVRFLQLGRPGEPAGTTPRRTRPSGGSSTSSGPRLACRRRPTGWYPAGVPRLEPLRDNARGGRRAHRCVHPVRAPTGTAREHVDRAAGPSRGQPGAAAGGRAGRRCAYRTAVGGLGSLRPTVARSCSGQHEGDPRPCWSEVAVRGGGGWGI